MTQTTEHTETKVDRHMKICKELNALFEHKNHDYGDSFHQSFLEEGLAMARIRLGDKYNRFKTLSRQDTDQQVDDESIRDTLIDLANYAIMTVMELDEQSEQGRSESEHSEGDKDTTTLGFNIQLEPKDPHDPSAWSYPYDEVRTVYAFGSGSPQDATQGLSGEGGDRIGVYKKISLDDIVESYRLALEDANERTMSALDRVIAAGKESFGAFEAEFDEEENYEDGYME